MEQRAADEGAEGSGHVDGGGVEAHRHGQPRVPRDFAEQGPPYRVVHCPAAPAQHRPGRDVPELEAAGVGEDEEHRAGNGQHREAAGEEPLAIEAGGERSEGAPTSMVGMVRAKSIAVTRNGEPVSWNV